MANGAIDSNEEAGRLDRLDGLRGLAAAVVAFIYHGQPFFDPAHALAGPRLLVWFQTWGWAFVDLFFVISGYIFAHVYLRGQGLQKSGLADFAVARIARLYPLHLATLLLCALLFTSNPANTWYAFLAHLVMAQAFVPPVALTFDGPSWSLSIEVVCYILFAIGAAGGKRSLRIVSVAAIAYAVLHLGLLGRSGGPWVGDQLPRGLLGFFIGQALWHGRARLARVPAWMLAIALALGTTVSVGTLSPLLPLGLIAWPAALLLALRVPAMGSVPLRWLGDRSYSIYLIHGVVYMLAGAVLPKGTGGWGLTLALYAAILLASDLSFRLFETPARVAIRARWARRRKPLPIPAKLR